MAPSLITIQNGIRWLSMKRFQFGMFISSVSFWFGYILESIKLGYNSGKTTAQNEVD